jgi:hypothetical protein
MYPLIRRFYARKRDQWHGRRADLFMELMRPARRASILDLGGGEGEFMMRLGRRADLSVTVADINVDALERARSRGFETVLLDESTTLPFADKKFDIVFCNSVIEHVTLPKDQCTTPGISEAEWSARSFENQLAFAREVARVGKGYFVQTPHRSFPIEAHTWLPFVGWMSHNATVHVVRVADSVWVKKCGYADWHLLDSESLQRLFPEASIHLERSLGLPKSLIAYARPSATGDFV